MSSRQVGWIVLGGGIILSIIGAVWIVMQGTQGIQPWGPLLSDNVIFAKAMPFILGLGILVGLAHALLEGGPDSERQKDGQVRRFNTTTIVNHWVNAVGFLLALVTGSVQYLVGILDVPPPWPLYIFYRLHFIGASLVVFAVSSFVTHRVMVSDWQLLPKRGNLLHELRGLVDELPRFIGVPLAVIVGLNLRRRPPRTGQFTFYERLVSFPFWSLLLTFLIITGLIKSMRYLYPVSGAVVFWASAIHVASMILLAAKLLDHLRFVLSPSRWQLLVSMFTGRVSENYVKEHHPAWYEELNAAQNQEEVADAASSERGPTQTINA